ncbi:MAG: arylsulfatase [Ignavibacteriae bacterium]|nr:arylsulfatase [Ignavibacteriota bacterium]
MIEIPKLKNEKFYFLPFIIATIFLFGCEQKINEISENPKPNILLIMADDMGYSDLGCYGSEISTPNIDKLAKEGIRFTQFYNSARCCPTRASLLTGLYSHQAGMGTMVTTEPDTVKGAYQGYINDNCVTLAEVLKTVGYKTYMSGKWHVGEFESQWPNNRGFDEYYGLVSGAMNYFDIAKSKREGLERVFVKNGKRYTPPTEGFYSTDAFTEEAIGYLTQHNSENPFFLYLAYNAPHWPLHAYPEDIKKYKGRYKDGWAELRKQRWQKQKALGIVDESWELSPQDPEAMNWEDVKDKERMDLKMAIYAAQIDRMDANIGRVINKLSEMDQLDNTLIIFLSDNGACAEEGALGFEALGGWDGKLDTKNSYASYGRSWANASNTPFRLHKSWVHEGGISTPFIARFPKMIKPDQVTDQLGHVIDLMSTFVEVSGATYPKSKNGKSIIPLEGKSLVPVLSNDKSEPHNSIYWEHFGNKAIRKGDWKLVSVANGDWELYNIKKDRTELNNLIDEQPQIFNDLNKDYQKWAVRVGVKNN